MSDIYMVRAEDLHLVEQAPEEAPSPISTLAPDVVVTARVPRDLHRQIKRAIEDDVDGGSLQAFIVGACKVYLEDRQTAELIRQLMPGRGGR